MTELRKAAEMALWALRYINQYSLAPHNISLPGEIDTAVDALRAALAQPEPEPVAWMYEYANPRRGQGLGFDETPDFEATCVPLYNAPPQRKPLTEEEIYKMFGWYAMSFVRAVERTHGIS